MSPLQLERTREPQPNMSLTKITTRLIAVRGTARAMSVRTSCTTTDVLVLQFQQSWRLDEGRDALRM